MTTNFRSWDSITDEIAICPSQKVAMHMHACFTAGTKIQTLLAEMREMRKICRNEKYSCSVMQAQTPHGA